MFGGMVQRPINKIRSITKNQNEENPCSGLNSITDIETGEVVCSDCGQVLSEKVEELGREGRSFQNNPKDIQRSRVGPGTSLAKHDMGLTTIIGLKNKEITLCDILVTIPASKEYPTMNISHAVAIILYELFKEINDNKSNSHISFATKKEKDITLNYINNIIDKINFSTKKKKETQKIVWKRIIGKALLTKREAYAVMGFFRKI